MGFQLSPGVSITETDLTTIVPAVATTAGAFCGKFVWGPVDEIQVIDSENKLRSVFGLPEDDNAQDWFTAASFLSYGNNLQVVRVGNDSTGGMENACATDAVTCQIRNEKHYNDTSTTTLATFGEWIAKYPGELGNALSVITIDGNADDSTQNDAGAATWVSEFNGYPGTSPSVEDLTGLSDVSDEIHILVIDRTGAWTGTANTVLERFAYVSKASNATNPDGTSNYYKDVINKTSAYVWWGMHTEDAIGWDDTDSTHTSWGSEASPSTTAFGILDDGFEQVNLSGGTNALDTIDGDDVLDGFEEHFSNADVVDVSLLISGDLTAVQQQTLVDIADERKDCIAFLSCREGDGSHSVINLADCQAHRIALGRSSSYAVLDSGWKYMYDRYNDTYRYVPLNGDVAGCVVQTDQDRDPWWSPAGFNRGRIRNVVKLPFNPSKTDRDYLYKDGINPVVTFEGEGTILFGDKTLLARPSAFDRINVRRLFIVLEKAIATAAKYSLFEFNDFFTRQQFKSMIEPYLRDIQSRRGIQDFKVICDETNNTPQVIDSNRFIADIFIKPNRVINFIQLNFIATPTGLDFDEIGG